MGRALAVLADRAYDTTAMEQAASDLNAELVVPSKKNRKYPRKIDKHLYKERHTIECCFGKLKQFRRIATRYEKTAASFLGMVHLASALLWLR